MLRLLGSHRVDDHRAPKLPRAAYLAAAIVDLSPGLRITRAQLAARLWESAETSVAHANLRQLLARVRRWESVHDLVVFEVDPAGVARRAGTLPSDLGSFLRLESARTSETLGTLEELYAGELLADVRDDGGELGFWLTQQRAALRERYVALARDGALHVGGTAGAGVLERLERESPFDDSVVRAHMVTLAQAGDRHAVRRVFERFVARAHDELAGAPEPQTAALFEELTGSPARTPARVSDVPGSASTIGGIPRVLILPPVGQAATRGLDMLALSLTDAITHTLSRARVFAVFAPHTARQLASAPFPGGNPYGVDYLVTIKLVPEHDAKVTLHVMMTSIASHEVLLAEQVRFAAEALKADHFALASALAAKLAGTVRNAELGDYRATGSASAFVHHLLGSEYLGSFSLQRVRRARGHFQHALKLSEHFAPARSMLARSLCLEWLLLDRRDKGLLDASLEHARRALDEDPLDPIAYREFGHAQIYLDRIDEAVDSLESGVQLGPHFADVLFHYADGLAHLGRIPEARRAMDRALSLNPLPPDFYLWVSATTDYFLGNYAAASASLDRLKEKEPAARVIALVEAMNGNLGKAHRHRDIFMSNHPDFRLADYIIPQRRREDREHYLEGMRRAGFT